MRALLPKQALANAILLTTLCLPMAAQAAPADPATTTSPQPEQEQPRRRRFRIGPEIGVYLPTDSKTRDRFGDTWFTFGIGLGPIPEPQQRGIFGIDLNVLYRKRGDNRALVIPLGVSYRRSLSVGPTAPYVGASLNLVFADLKSEEDDVDSGLRTTAGASVFLGTTFSENGYVEARYMGISKIRGFDLSGLNLRAGLRF
uniref:Outer membrane protein beta-barrel domain-containing protein n=1 Tax=uncultured Armatimonadetes bacterium TaxID=157466 RepID=A0A6J4HXY1_9BACT|nr:hypothetical protein AVDCRST_MAG63-1222 [uncultured Armatimonadetes bacterium]